MSTNNPVSGEQVASEEPLGTPPGDADGPDERPEADDSPGDTGGTDGNAA